MDNPCIILLVSGKRKTGKDYICEKVKAILGQEKCEIIRISAPLKGLYAKQHDLDLNELMSDSMYKENYRLDMINWSEEIRSATPGYFCKAACDEAPIKPVWIVSDIRRKTDITWFKETYLDIVKTIRICADINTRRNRGWLFTKGVDDVASECDLDAFKDWDYLVGNNNNEESEDAIRKITDIARNCL